MPVSFIVFVIILFSPLFNQEIPLRFKISFYKKDLAKVAASHNILRCNKYNIINRNNY